MVTTPARVFRSNASTPASGNTAGSVSTRGRRRKDPPSTINDNDDDDDEPLLQTQLPLPTQHERDDEGDDDEDYEDENVDKNLNDTKSRPQPRSSNVKRTAKKTISTGPRPHSQSNSTLTTEDNEEEEEEAEDAAPEIAVKPEISEAIDGSGTNETTMLDPNIAKQRIDQYYFDILDQEQHKILFDRSSRITSWPTLQHFWNTFPYKEYEYGRLYVRTRLCSLLVDGNSEPGYSTTSLVAWEATDWQDFIDDFRTTKDACLNPNCSHIFGFDNEDLNREESLIESHRANSKNFNQKYSIVEKTCQMNLLLSPIRQALEAQILTGATGPPTGVSEADVKNLHSAAGSCDSFVVRKHLYRLFVPADDADPASGRIDEDEDEYDEGAPPQVVLKNLEDLKEVLRTKPLDLIWLQSRIDRLIWTWNEECFGTKLPHLEVIGYHKAAHRTPHHRRVNVGTPGPKTPPALDRDERTNVLETLKRRRNALNKNHGDDPLSESRKIAASTKANTKATSDVVPGKNILYQGKKSNIVVQFDDSDDEAEVKHDGDDVDEDDAGNESTAGRVRLPTLPKKRRIMKSPSATREGVSSGGSKVYTGPPPDEGIFDEYGNVVQRHPWDEEEIAALLSGLEKHGLGKWVYIKQEYGYILRNRTTVQLKDKFRNMKKNGELPDRYVVAGV